jgi:nicotinamidase/pyrazinamidase
MESKKALLVVDIQNDFCPGGALGAEEGDLIIPIMNKYIDLFQKNKLPVFFSRDWHPPTTKHFKEFGGPWPSHCVQDTKGAEFHPGLNMPSHAIILSKGTDPGADGYSAFDARSTNRKPLEGLLKELGVVDLYIGGIATDYCVKMSSLDALERGYHVYILSDAIKGVDKHDSERAIEAILEKNGKLKTFTEVSKELKK